MSVEPNLFSRLHKWAARQDENFLTESLAIVLETLLVLAPDVGTRLVERLSGDLICLPATDAGVISVHTQVETGKGRPDLELSAPHRLAWVEVKVESELRIGQLEGYRVLLDATGIAHRRLILLSRYPEVFSAEECQPDRQIRWYEFADWIETELPALEENCEISYYLARQFLEFLRERNMTLTQVGKYMPDGLRALSSLLNMLREAAAACKVPVGKVSSGWDFMGLYLDGTKYWIGFLYADPEKLWFGTRCKINPEAAAQLGVGEVTEESWVPGRYRWWNSAILDSEEVHFFARSKVSQMEWLEGFLRDCLLMARSIETPDQPTIPEESQGA